jgi:type III restriction enzyme
LEKAEIGETATADKPYKARLAAIIEAADLSETKKVRLSALKKKSFCARSLTR